MDNEEINRIKHITNRFRKDLDDFWVGIKKLLVAKGINVSKLVVADSFSEDTHMIYVVVITPDKQVFEFYYDWIHREESNGLIKEWKDFTNNPDGAYRNESVKLALQLVGKI